MFLQSFGRVESMKVTLCSVRLQKQAETGWLQQQDASMENKTRGRPDVREAFKRSTKTWIPSLITRTRSHCIIVLISPVLYYLNHSPNPASAAQR